MAVKKLGEFTLVFQSPISGSQTIVTNYITAGPQIVSIPYKRVTNDRGKSKPAPDQGFQSPISGSQTALIHIALINLHQVSIPYKRVTNQGMDCGTHRGP